MHLLCNSKNRSMWAVYLEIITELEYDRKMRDPNGHL